MQKIYPDGIEIRKYPYNIKNAGEIQSAMNAHGCTDLVVVTNINILQELTESGIFPLRACMDRIKNCGDAPKYEHRYFTRVREVKIREERLT